MDLLNAKIIHKTLGVGSVTEFNGKYLTVEFATKTSRFVYPDAFLTFIKAEDAGLQSAIIAEIEAARKAEEERERKRLEYERAEQAKQRKLEEQIIAVLNVIRPYLNNDLRAEIFLLTEELLMLSCLSWIIQFLMCLRSVCSIEIE